MAKTGKILEQDIIEKKVYDIGQKFGDSLDPATKAIENFEKQWLSSVNAIKQSALELNKIQGDYTNVESQKNYIKLKDLELKATEKAEKAIKLEKQTFTAYTQERVKQEKLLISTANKVKLAEQGRTDALVKQRYEMQQLTKRAKESAVLSSKLSTEYEKQAVKLTILRRRYKDVALTEGETSKKAKQLRAEITKLDTTLKRVDAHVGQFQRNVGNYGKAMQSAGAAARTMMSAMGFAGGAYLFINVMRNAGKIVRDFEKQNATLSSILQVERKEMSALTDDAKRLGQTTVKTAGEVVQLQTAYARLGFTQQEIIDLTEATINGSIAMNAELDKTAELTGAVVNTFDDFSTTDAPEILDILSLATAKSALNFQKLETGIPIVAGAANAAGVPFTKLIALMGKLSDSGIDISSSSTALRNIFIESAAQGLSYDEILEKIKNSQDKLTASNDEFGKRAAVSASVLANNIDKTKELDEALQNAAGTAQKMAEKELDTLDGQIKLLDSAWQGFVLSIESGDGTIAKSLRSILAGFNSILSTLTLINKTEEERNKEVSTNIYKKRLESLNDIKNQQTQRIELLEIERKTNDKNSEAYIKANEEILKHQELQKNESIAIAKISKDNAESEIANIKNKIYELEQLDKATAASGDFIQVYNTQEIEKLKNTLATQNGILKASTDFINENTLAIDENAGKNKEAADSTKELTAAEKKAKREREKANKAYERRLELLEKEKKARGDLLKQADFDLRKSNLESEIEAQKEILKNEKSTLLEKQIANLNYYDAKKQLLDITKQKEIDDLNETLEAKKKKDLETAILEADKNKIIEDYAEISKDRLAEIELKYNDDLIDIAQERQNNGLAFLKTQFNNELKLIKEAKQAQIDAQNQEIGAEQNKLSASARTPEDVEAYEKAVYEIKKKYALLEVQAQINKIKELQKNKSFSVEEQALLAKQLSDLEIQYSNISTGHIIDDIEKQKQAAEELAEQRQRLISQMSQGLSVALNIDTENLNVFLEGVVNMFDSSKQGIENTLQTLSAASAVTRDIIGSVYDANIQNLQSQLDASNEYYDNQYQRAEGDAEQQDLIREEQQLKEEQLKKKIAKEKTKAAKADKAAALIQAGINTALAITAALATTPFLPLGPAMAILAGVLGAVQIAAIAAKPIPKFKDGHLAGTHEGLAITNDGGRDEVWERDGKFKIIKGRNVPIHMKKGDKIHRSIEDSPIEKYKELMRASILASVEIDNKNLKAYQAEKSFSQSDKALREEMELTRKAIAKSKSNVIVQTQKPIDLNHELFRFKNTNWS